MGNISNKKTLIILLILVGLMILLGLGVFIYSLYLDKNLYHYSNSKIKANYNPVYISEVDSKVRDIIEKSKENGDSLILTSKINTYKNLKFIYIDILDNGNKKNLFYVFDNKEKKYKFNEFFNNTTSLKMFYKKIDKRYNYFYFNKTGLILGYDNGDVSFSYNEINNLLANKYRNKNVKLPVVRDIEKFRNKKLLCFTFDDGPNEKTTGILLNNLDKYEARVSFFVLGNRVNANKNVLKRAYFMGNDIGSHTFDHKDLTSLKTKKVLWEINTTNDRIRNVVGLSPKYLRPPYGSTNNRVMKLHEMNTMLWNVDSLDWKLKKRNKIKKRILKYAKDGNIILVHDIYEESIYGALLAMDELYKEGYRFVSISEMSYLKDVDLDNNKVHFGF